MQDKAAAAIRSSRQKLQPLKLDPLRHSDCKIAKKKIITVSPPELSLVSELSEKLQFRKMPTLKKSLTLQRAKKSPVYGKKESHTKDVSPLNLANLKIPYAD